MYKQILTALSVMGFTLLAGCLKAQGSVAPPLLALPPQAIVDVATVVTNSTNNTIDVLANDIDTTGTGLTVTSVAVDLTVPPMPGATATTDGQTVSFTPAAGFLGVVTLDYSIVDGTGQTASSVVVVTVLPAALLPLALPDAATITQNAAATLVDVVANDLDPAGGGLTLSAATVTASLPIATHSVSISGNKVQFTPAAGFIGAVVVTYTVTDVNGNTALGLLSLLVLPLNVAVGPVPLPDAAVVAQNSAATDVDVLANDVDPAAGGLTVSGVSVTASVPTAVHTVSISGNKVRFTPAAGFVGAVVITYTATDVNGNSAPGLLNVIVSPLALQLGPVAVPDAAVVAQDSGATDINVAANDIDVAAGGLTVTGVSVTASVPTAVHTVSISGNKVRFTPAAGFVGAVVVTYTVTDVNGASTNGLLNVVVSPLALGLGPVAVPDAAIVAQDAAATDINVIANDVDVAAGGLTLTAASVTASVPNAVQTVTISGNKVRFTPAAGFSGAVVVGYTIKDVNNATSNGLLNIVVTPTALTAGPIAIPDVATVAENSGATDINVIANDVDTAGGGLVVTVVSVTASVPTATHTVSISANKVRFTPAAGFAGTAVVSYTVTDVNGHTGNGLLNVVVTPTALTLGPVAIPDVATVAQDAAATNIDVAANDIDTAAGGLTVTAVSVTASVPTATHAVTISSNKVRFTPAAGFAGTVAISYTVKDVNNATSNGVLSVLVTPTALSLGPVAVPDAATVAQDSGASNIDVTANDVDTAGGGLTVSAVSVTASVPTATHTVTISSNKVRFTPAAGFAGTVVVSYTVTDVNGHTGSGLLDVVVTPTALALGPVAIPDVATVAENSGATDINVAANDVDTAGGGLTVSAVSVTASVPSATHTVTISGNKVRFTPAAGFAGTVVVSYTVIDVNGHSSNGLLDVVVTPTALTLGPVAIPDAATVAQDSGATDINVAANDVDTAAGGLTVTAASVTLSLPTATHTVTIVGNKVRFTPAAGFAGTVVIGYTVKDVNNATSSGVLNVVVTPTALTLGVLAVPDVGTATSAGGAQLFNVLANDVDPAGGGLTLSNVSVTLAVPASPGSVTVVANKVQYTPSLLYVGTLLIQYTATDINGKTSVGQLSLTVL